MDPIRQLTEDATPAGPLRVGIAFAATGGLAPAWGWDDIKRGVTAVATGGLSELGGARTLLDAQARERERQMRRAQDEAARAQAALERRAREETARRLQEERRAARRRTGRQSTILASAPLGVSAPPGPSAGGRATLG